jgi:hypothetical protein
MVTEKKPSLKKVIQGLSKEELVGLVSELNKKYKVVNTFLVAKFWPNSAKDIIKEFKKKIRDEFFPQRGCGKANLSNVREAISTFSKVSNDTASVVDLW